MKFDDGRSDTSCSDIAVIVLVVVDDAFIAMAGDAFITVAGDAFIVVEGDAFIVMVDAFIVVAGE